MSKEGSISKQVCAQCLGALLWDAEARALRCQACGALQKVEDDGVIAEHDLADALRQHKLRGLVGAGTRLVRCGDCHAEVEIPDEITATRCEFCGSAMVLSVAAADDHYLPESLIPFSVDRAAAVRAFQKWLGSMWLRPSNLRHAASLHELSGIYIPFWSFDCEITSRWSADAGYTTYREETTPQGKRRVPQVRWQPCSGQRHDGYEDHLVCASHGLPPGLGRSVNRYSVSGLLPYSPEYLLGFSAERYALDLREAWQQARASLGTQQERRCAQDIPGDTQRSLRATHEFRSVRFKHVLLPMWIAAYRYQGKLHRFIVNGQTGHVEGTAPRSAVKIAILVSLAVMLLAAILFYLHHRTPQPQLLQDAVNAAAHT